LTFTQLEFLVFLAGVLVVYWMLPRRGQNVWLVAATFVFYGWVHPGFVLLLLASVLLHWSAGLAMDTWPAWRLAFLRLAIFGSVVMLGVFKYLDFLVANVAAALAALGLETDLHTLGILLPVGISFYTFQTLSYSIDVYTRAIPAERSLPRYLSTVAFFPQLVAGPIGRTGDLLPQFANERVLDFARMRSGVSLALWGIVKKTVVADTIAPYVNAIYAADQPSNAMAWAAALGFMVQILADFSAYTDIARGTARLFGIELKQNFDHPYRATSPEDFWRRWHISLSEWLRDYVYLPIYDWKWARRWVRPPGLPDDFKSRVARAAMLTMLFSGLWHGAAWHFVVWGGFWGVLHVVWVYAKPLVPKRWTNGRWVTPLGIALMLVLNLCAHQIFREPFLARLPGRFLGNPFAGTEDELVVATMMLSVALAGAAVLLLAELFRDHVLARIRTREWSVPIETSLWAAAAWCTFTFAWQSEAEFIYFRF
jgi:D-alanyl-lipoteichoic acid acyltransferase DltB (MBOAT superfamily)